VSADVIIGPFVSGEIPPPLEYQFLDSGGVGLDLTGYAAKFSCVELGGATVTVDVADATVTDPATGKVTYTWTGVEFPTAGRYQAELWVGDGTLRFASVLIAFTARRAVASVPSI
jgi:baseplate upper protein BppU